METWEKWTEQANLAAAVPTFRNEEEAEREREKKALGAHSQPYLGVPRMPRNSFFQ